MNSNKKINNRALRPRVLVSPLDWGLGHAARCIPIINELILYECEIFIAAEGATASLLKKEFPQLNFLSLKGYRITFSRNKSFFALRLINQLPKIIYTIYKERQWLKKIVNEYKIDAIISDNRVGLYHNKITSVYITHQLLIKTGNVFTAKIAQYIHDYFIRKFNECWVPDFEHDNLAGDLSHPRIIPKNVRYVGALSRFEKKENCIIKYEFLILLSGPEPQRTILEEIFLNDLSLYKGMSLLIRGLPDGKKDIASKNNSVKIINHLSSDELSEAIQQAGTIISRSGYTTIMDLVKLNKKAIIIPTPGQGEQEYLAVYLKDKNIFFSVQQENFNLTKTLAEFSKFTAHIPVLNMAQYKATVQNFVRNISTQNA